MASKHAKLSQAKRKNSPVANLGVKHNFCEHLGRDSPEIDQWFPQITSFWPCTTGSENSWKTAIYHKRAKNRAKHAQIEFPFFQNFFLSQKNHIRKLKKFEIFRPKNDQHPPPTRLHCPAVWHCSGPAVAPRGLRSSGNPELGRVATSATALVGYIQVCSPKSGGAGGDLYSTPVFFPSGFMCLLPAPYPIIIITFQTSNFNFQNSGMTSSPNTNFFCEASSGE